VKLLIFYLKLKLSKTDSIKRLQCCLDSEGYAIVMNETSKCSGHALEDDFFGVLNVDTFLTFISSKIE